MKVSSLASPPVNVRIDKAIEPKIHELQSNQSFEQVLQQTRSAIENLIGGRLGSGFNQLDGAIKKGFKLSPQELIIYQVRAGEFGLRVELVSKMAESLMSGVRKFQNPS